MSDQNNLLLPPLWEVVLGYLCNEAPSCLCLMEWQGLAQVEIWGRILGEALQKAPNWRHHVARSVGAGHAPDLALIGVLHHDQALFECGRSLVLEEKSVFFLDQIWDDQQTVQQMQLLRRFRAERVKALLLQSLDGPDILAFLGQKAPPGAKEINNRAVALEHKVMSVDESKEWTRLAAQHAAFQSGYDDKVVATMSEGKRFPSSAEREASFRGSEWRIHLRRLGAQVAQSGSSWLLEQVGSRLFCATPRDNSQWQSFYSHLCDENPSLAMEGALKSMRMCFWFWHGVLGALPEGQTCTLPPPLTWGEGFSFQRIQELVLDIQPDVPLLLPAPNFGDVFDM